MASQLKQEPFIEKVAAALRSGFPGAIIDLEPYDALQVTGEIAWAGFSPNNVRANRLLLSKILREKLGKEAERVIMLFTLTPIQKKVMDEDRLAEEESILATAKRIVQDRRKKARAQPTNAHNGHHAAAPKKRKLTTHG
jgi:hypothetical protein